MQSLDNQYTDMLLSLHYEASIMSKSKMSNNFTDGDIRVENLFEQDEKFVIDGEIEITKIGPDVLLMFLDGQHMRYKFEWGFEKIKNLILDIIRVHVFQILD
jgi:hypothetical protein